MGSRPAKIGTSSTHWFARGLASGVVLIAACNAISYFFRTPGIADLIGSDTHVSEAIGFPFEIWRENAVYHGSMFINYAASGLNLLVGLVVGVVFGVIAVRLKPQFNLWIEELENKNAHHDQLNFQFSVKSLLVITTVSALIIATLTNWKGTPEVLMAIYFLGPLVLIIIAMMPNQIHWKHRVAILSLTAFAMIGIAIWSGLILGVPIDRVLLGIFVSWTPQSAFAAFLMTAGLVTQWLWSRGAPETGPVR